MKEGQIILEKNGLDSEQTPYSIKVYFENNPLILRKVEVLINQQVLQISISDHNYNENFEEKFFKLISPKLLN